MTYDLRPLTASDRPWLRRFITEHWGAELIIIHGEQLAPAEHPGFAAFDGNEIIGLVTYAIRGDECEILSLDSLRESQGIGTSLIKSVREIALKNGCRRLCLSTTNDNLNALRFYQKRGFELVAIRRRAVEESRKLKPSIPLLGEFGIPLRDEIELEMPLSYTEHTG